jgi:hypothetical protein
MGKILFIDIKMVPDPGVGVFSIVLLRIPIRMNGGNFVEGSDRYF